MRQNRCRQGKQRAVQFVEAGPGRQAGAEGKNPNAQYGACMYSEGRHKRAQLKAGVVKGQP